MPVCADREPYPEWLEKGKKDAFALAKERLETAARVEVPDRVPIAVNTIYLPARYAGITYHDLFYDYSKFTEAAVKFAKDFNWDAVGYLRSFDSATLGLTLAGYDPELATNVLLLPFWLAEGYMTFWMTNILPTQERNSQKTLNLSFALKNLS